MNIKLNVMRTVSLEFVSSSDHKKYYVKENQIKIKACQRVIKIN
jgi:hypothetical protein